MKKTILLLLYLALTSCNWLEPGYSIGNKRSEVLREVNPENELDSHGLPLPDTVVYVTGVDFPKDYDWRRDTAYGGVRFNIVVFANGKRTMNIPAGSSDKISPDPDMHRLVQGKLYTNYYDGGRTTIKCNGSEIFSYEGSEVLKGFLADGDAIYTLGQERAGEGFVFRKNGEKVFGSDKGYVLGNISGSPSGTGALTKDNCISFIYYIPLYGAPPPRYSWFIVKDGRQETVELPKEINNMLDMKYLHGNIYIIAKCGYRYMLFVGDKPVPIVGCDPRRMKMLRLLISGDGVFVVGEDFMNYGLRTRVWDERGEKVYDTSMDGQAIGSGGRAMYIYQENGKFAYPVVKEGFSIKGINSGGKFFPIKENACLLADNCATYRHERLYAAFTPLKPGRNPFLWIEGEKHTMELNGYLTSVEVVVNKEEEDAD